MHELPLVFFTVFGQAAAGLFLLALFATKLGSLTEAQLKKANIVAFVLLAVGLAIGGLHMGKPLRAMNLIFGAVRSPMSNEILLSGAFMGAAFTTVALSFSSVRDWSVKVTKQRVTPKLLNMIAPISNIATVVLGLAFAWSITQVYQLDTVAAWNTNYTSLQLWLTVVIAGGACAMALGMKQLGAISVVVGSVGSLAMRLPYIDFVTEQVPHLADQQHGFWVAHAVMVVIALCVAGLTLFNRRQISPIVLSVSAVAMICGELLSRIAFYNLWWISM
jgi:anaerobic dimethyl sulfoxide reductase subunit C (anchor subunit)